MTRKKRNDLPRRAAGPCRTLSVEERGEVERRLRDEGRLRPDELTVIGPADAMRKRVVVRCSACGRAFVVGVTALTSAHCGCAPLSADRWAELRSEAHDLDLRRQLNDWWPGER
jgi:hypothetical protein